MADERAATAYPEGGASRRVVYGTLTYGLASVLQRAAPLLLLPLFAQILSPEEFGQIGIILTLTAALSTVAALGLETAVFRGYRQAAAEAQGPAEFVSSLGWFGILAPFGVAAIGLILLGPLVVGGFDLPPVAVALGAVTASATASATIVPLAILRAQERLRTYLALTSAQVLISAGLAIFLIVVLDLGVVGWMLGSALAGLVILVRGVLAVEQPLARHVNRSLVVAALAFGLPLVPHALAHWGLAVSDRAILGAFLDQAVVGVYYVAFLFSLPVSLIAIAISQATQPLFAGAALTREQQSTLGRVVSIQSAVVILVGAAAALLGPPASRLILPAEYADAARYIPLLCLGTTLFGLYLAPMNAISLIAGRTGRV
ncbi:MAG TPA: oligosaccharide flippase family protein, partial [Candidatus Limnocylindria bacterium]|nr:oligosaccharide flippase family protein [Candidatus Limnocylindria bacterium]